MFAFKIHNEENYTVFSIAGSIDIYSSLDLKAEFDEKLVNFAGNIILDFKNVDYVDSSGIGVMIRLLNQAEEQGKVLKLARLRPIILKIFKVAGLTDFFEVLPDQEFHAKFKIS